MMNLKDLLNQDKLRAHKTSKKEIDNLLTIIRRDIKDSKVEDLSPDRRFACDYNAVLLYGKSYIPKGTGLLLHNNK